MGIGSTTISPATTVFRQSKFATAGIGMLVLPNHTVDPKCDSKNGHATSEH